MADVLPDCMMPDGAEPCAGYRRLDADHRADLVAARLQGWRDGCADAAAAMEAMAARAQASGSTRNARIWDAAASVARALPEPDYSEEGDQWA